MPTPDLFVPVVTPAPPASWSPPAGYTGALRYGNWVQVAGAETCLNVRAVPGLIYPNTDPPQDVPTLNCLPDGFIGQLSFGPNYDWSYGQPVPVQADGHWWWNLLGQGWVAEDWLTFLSEESASPYSTRPELAGAGLIAFVRNDGVWVANADGTSPHLLYQTDPNHETVTTLRWSPDGQLLALGLTLANDLANYAATQIVDLNGSLVAEYPGLSEPSFSPDGASLAGLRVSQPGGLGGYQATPVVLDRETGAETPVGPAGAFFLQGPQWSPDGLSLTFVCVGGTSTTWQPDGSYVEQVIDCGGDGIQVVSVVDGSKQVVAPTTLNGGPFYLAPTFSPDGSMIAASVGNSDCDGYALFDVASGTRQTCFSLPAYGNFGGSCGGSAESGASDWSPDGTKLAYHWQFRAGQNGVALVDVATGDREMILTTGAASIDFSRDGQHLVFESAGYIWTADSDATDVTRMTDGRLPAWQPLP